MIRNCTDVDIAAIEAIINEAAQAYRGVIPTDCWHEPYMPQSDLMAEGRAVREKTARLRALRLDKEAAEKNEGSQRTPVSPWLPEKRRTMAASRKNTRMQSRLEKAARENHNLSVDYEVQAKIIREKTARLKALRLAKEGAEKKNSAA